MMKIKRRVPEIIQKEQNLIGTFSSSHEYYMHDVKYDFYGERMATCSTDHHIKVFDLQKSGKWKLNQSWKAHDSTIFRIDWANPEFGQILASCSLDGSVTIWEETTIKGKTQTKTKWVKVRRLKEHSKSNICDLKFGPKHFGLKLGFCDRGGSVRIFNAPKVMDLNIWDEESSFKSCDKGCSCLDWNKSHTDGLVMVVGGMDGSVKVWAWSLAVQKWMCLTDLAATSKVNKKNPIHDVSWAPMMGRTYFLIAAVAKHRKLRIWMLKKEQQKRSNEKKTLNFKTHEMKVEMGKIKEGELWSVNWNVTGSILAAGGVGKVYLFKYSKSSMSWKCSKIVNQ